MLGTTISQTTSLIVAITGLVAAVGSIVAAVLGTLNRRALTTPSGTSVGKQVESAHLTAIANNWLLAKQNGPTKAAEADQLQAEGMPVPQVPVDSPPVAPQGS